MKRLRLLAAALVLPVLTSGCVNLAAPVIPPAAAIASFSAPLDTEFDNTTLGALEGEASVTSFLSLVSFGDASAATAASNGGITTIRHADYRYFTFLGLFSTYTTVVYGD